MRLPVPIATLCARALQTKPRPDRRSRSRVQTKHGGLGLGSTWVWGWRCKIRARSVPGEGIDEKLLWFVSLGFEPVLADVPRVHREESGKQQLHLWSLPGARGEGGGKGGGGGCYVGYCSAWGRPCSATLVLWHREEGWVWSWVAMAAHALLSPNPPLRPRVLEVLAPSPAQGRGKAWLQDGEGDEFKSWIVPLCHQ